MVQEGFGLPEVILSRLKDFLSKSIFFTTEEELSEDGVQK